MITNREKFYKKYGIEGDLTLNLRDISNISGMPLVAIQESYNRGVGAWKTNPESVRLRKDYSKNPNMGRYPRSSRLTKENWGYGRAYAFVMKTDKVFYGADKDIAEKYNLL